MLNAPPDPAGNDPLIGAVLGGRYRVDRVVGRGGAGVIYYAMHEELGRPAAVKVLGAAWASDDNAIERFQREARAASNVGHRNIIDVYDMGQLPDGRPYLVMEWLEGRELGTLMELEGTLDPWLTANIVRQAGSALEAVHSKGIVHRDIKPENFFLHMDEDGTYVLKLLDFGLAAIHRPGSDVARLTRHGVIHGTPHYMAPEATGLDLPDHRADVYSLAVVAFEMLTAGLPFDSENPMQILTRKITDDPPTMAEVAGHAFPEQLEQVMAWGLAREPEARCAGAGRFAEVFMDAVRSATWENIGKISGVHPAPPVTHPTHTTSDNPISGPPPAPEELKRISHNSVPPAPVPVITADLTGSHSTRDSDSTGSHPTLADARVTLAPERSGRRWILGGILLLTLLSLGIGMGYWLSSRDAPAPVVIRHTLPAPALEPEPEPLAETEPEPERLAETEPEPEPTPVIEEPTARQERRQRRSTTTRDDQDRPSLAQENRDRARELSREGTSALLQGRLPEAIGLFREATNAHVGNTQAWRGLGLANERLGRSPEAVRAYERYLRIAPDARDAEEVQERIDSLGG